MKGVRRLAITRAVKQAKERGEDIDLSNAVDDIIAGYRFANRMVSVVRHADPTKRGATDDEIAERIAETFRIASPQLREIV